MAEVAWFDPPALRVQSVTFAKPGEAEAAKAAAEKLEAEAAACAAAWNSLHSGLEVVTGSFRCARETLKPYVDRLETWELRPYCGEQFGWCRG